MAPSLAASADARTQATTAAPAQRAGLSSGAQAALSNAIEQTDRFKVLAGIYNALSAGASAAAPLPNGDFPLHLAARHQDPASAVSAIEALVREGALVNAKSMAGRQATALHNAVTNPNPAAAVAAVEALASARADVNSRDMGGHTPLHCITAAASSSAAVAAVVPALIAAGADVTARALHGWTPLHKAMAWAASPGVAEAAVKALVAAGCNPDVEDLSGNTPLHLVVQSNSPAAAAAAKALLAAGADRHLKNSHGKCAIDLALERPDVIAWTGLLRALLGDARTDVAGGGGEEAGRAGPSSSNNHGVLEALTTTKAIVDQLSTHNLAKRKRTAEPTKPKCPVCLEPGACMTGPCGHLVCEGCSKKREVIQKCPKCGKERGPQSIFKVHM